MTPPMTGPTTQASQDLILSGAYHVEGCAVHERGGPGCDCGLPDALLTVEAEACADAAATITALREARIEQRGFHRALEYVRQAVASEPTLSWPGEIDDILEMNRAYAVVAVLLDAEVSEGGEVSAHSEQCNSIGNGPGHDQCVCWCHRTLEVLP